MREEYPSIVKYHFAGGSEEIAKIPSKMPEASQLTDLLSKVEKGIATDEDRIALAFGLKEDFKTRFGALSEQEAVLLQEIALGGNAKEIIEGFNSVWPSIAKSAVVPDDVLRGNILQMLSDGIKPSAITDLYKNGKNAAKESMEELDRIYKADSTEQSKIYTRNGVLVNFGLYDSIDKLLDYSKKSFLNAPTTEMKYNWYKVVYKTLKDNGRDVEALQFFKDKKNMEFLFAERIKTVEKAHALLMTKVSDLGMPEAREELAWLLNKYFKPEEPVTADDLVGAKIFSKDEMKKELEMMVKERGEDPATADEIIRYSIPIVLPTQREVPAESILYFSMAELQTELAKKLGWPEEVGGRSLGKLQSTGRPYDTIPVWHENGVILLRSSVGSKEALHESAHIYWYLSRLVDEETVEGLILSELNSLFIDGKIVKVAKDEAAFYANRYAESYAARYRDARNYAGEPTKEKVKELERKIKQGIGTVNYLASSSVSTMDIQSILLTSRNLDDFNEWGKMSAEDLKALFGHK